MLEQLFTMWWGRVCVDIPHLKLLQLWSDQTLSFGQRCVTPLDTLMHLRHGVWGATTTLCAAAEHATLQQEDTDEACDGHNAAAEIRQIKRRPTCILRIWSLSRLWTISSTTACMRAWCASAISVRPALSLSQPSLREYSRRVNHINRAGLVVSVVSTAKLSPSYFTL